MSIFQIFSAEADQYREVIIDLWKENIPDTPKGRFEWMQKNPQGRPIWYFAKDVKKQCIAGAISIMPRRMKIRNEECLAGMVGDFMVKKEYRVFGPALRLIRRVVEEHAKWGFAFLYTFPNKRSEKIVLRSGFKAIGVSKRFIKPLNTAYILKRHIPLKLLEVIAPCADLALKVCSKETYMKTRLTVEEISEPEDLIEPSWERAMRYWHTMGERSSSYIKWRYFENPLYNFGIYLYRESSDTPVVGQIIYSIMHNTVHIFDIVTVDTACVEPILMHFIKEIRGKRYGSISIRLLNDSILTDPIRKAGFFDRSGEVPLLFAGDLKLLPVNWLFLDGDRNV